MKSLLVLLLPASPLLALGEYPPDPGDARVATYREVDGTFDEVMRKAGRPCKLVGYEGQGHGFFNRGKAYDQTLAEADRFLVELGWLKK